MMTWQNNKTWVGIQVKGGFRLMGDTVPVVGRWVLAQTVRKLCYYQVVRAQFALRISWWSQWESYSSLKGSFFASNW